MVEQTKAGSAVMKLEMIESTDLARFVSMDVEYFPALTRCGNLSLVSLYLLRHWDHLQ